jgi:hypothetical protein
MIHGLSLGAIQLAGVQVDVEDYVAFEMNTSKPYQYHSDVVKWYPPGQKKKASKGNGKGKNKNKWY